MLIVGERRSRIAYTDFSPPSNTAHTLPWYLIGVHFSKEDQMFRFRENVIEQNRAFTEQANGGRSFSQDDPDDEQLEYDFYEEVLAVEQVSMVY